MPILYSYMTNSTEALCMWCSESSHEIFTSRKTDYTKRKTKAACCKLASILWAPLLSTVALLHTWFEISSAGEYSLHGHMRQAQSAGQFVDTQLVASWDNLPCCHNCSRQHPWLLYYRGRKAQVWYLLGRKLILLDYPWFYKLPCND